MNGTVAVRFAPGVVGETRRQAHLAAVPAASAPDSWLTYCGLRIPAEHAELSPGPAGMPCIRCLTAIPGSPPLPGPPG